MPPHQAKRASTSPSEAAASSSLASTEAEEVVNLQAPESLRKRSHDTLAELWMTGELCDVEVLVKDERFKAHRLVLATASPVIRALFASGMREARAAEESGLCTIRLHDIEAAQLSAVLQFIYTETLEARPDTLAGVMHCADKLEVLPLLECGAHFLLTSLSGESCIGTWELARSIARPQLEPLRQACKAFAESEFTELAAHPAELARLGFSLFIGLIASDQLLVDDETVVFKAVHTWIQRVRPPPHEALELYKVVRLPLCHAGFLKSDVEPALRAVEGGLELCLEAYRHHALAPALRDTTARSQPRLTSLRWAGTLKATGCGHLDAEGVISDNMLVWKTIGKLNHPDALQVYTTPRCLRTELRWSLEVTFAPVEMHDAGIMPCVYSDSIYVGVGVFDGDDCRPTKKDTRTCWSDHASFTVHRQRGPVCTLDVLLQADGSSAGKIWTVMKCAEHNIDQRSSRPFKFKFDQPHDHQRVALLIGASYSGASVRLLA